MNWSLSIRAYSIQVRRKGPNYIIFLRCVYGQGPWTMY